MRRNWMPLYIPDFLADTVHLTAAETGAYLCLIMDYWLHDGLPDDDHKLAQICRLPLKLWRQMRPTIAAFFHDGWRHKRIDAELDKMVGITERRRAAGSKGGTISSIRRSNGKQLLDRGASKTQANVQQKGQQTVKQTAKQTAKQNAANVQHTTQEDITTTFSEAARARATPAEIPENSTPDQPAGGARPERSSSVFAPAGFAEQARQAVAQSSGSIGSGELAEVLQARGWVK